MQTKNITAVLEDYLEAIWFLAGDTGVARVKDIADMLKVKRSSVTVAMKSLASKKLIVYSPYSFIRLTPVGKEIARCVGKKHATLRLLFEDIFRIAPPEAEVCACKMEHGMTKQLCENFSILTALIKSDKRFNKNLSEHLEKTTR
jgi:DtxR family Mn-dependent transcriptional regulator